jgi:hypothetical protein
MPPRDETPASLAFILGLTMGAAVPLALLAFS